MGRFNFVERRVARVLREPPSVRMAAGVIVMATAFVVVAAGLLMTIIDRKEYPTLGLGLWWALQTVTTVGYGDVAPSHPAGRLVAMVVMLEGIAFIAIVTALITSTFVARAEREHERQLVEDENRLTDRQLIEKRFDELERKLDVLAGARGPEGA
jgi:voltage-gated potassium channel